MLPAAVTVPLRVDTEEAIHRSVEFDPERVAGDIVQVVP
jgi:hypothetical protein